VSPSINLAVAESHAQCHRPSRAVITPAELSSLALSQPSDHPVLLLCCPCVCPSFVLDARGDDDTSLQGLVQVALYKLTGNLGESWIFSKLSRPGVPGGHSCPFHGALVTQGVPVCTARSPGSLRGCGSRANGFVPMSLLRIGPCVPDVAAD
jgi:hypothetical protein